MRVPHANPIIDGASVRTRRQALGLSVTEAAHQVGITPSYLSAIERGHRRTVAPARFNLICQVLGCEREDIEVRQQSAEATAA